jgi:hypothetical protein
MFAPRLRSSIGSAADVELQGEFVGILAACTRRLGPNVEEFANDLMSVYNDLLASRPGVSSIYQEVFMAVGALADSISNFDLYYISNFFQILEDGLNHYIDVDLCNMAIQLTSSLCFSLHEKFVPYCHTIMKIFQDLLNASDLPSSLAPTIINAFSDIAYVMEAEFVRYLDPIMEILQRYSGKAAPNTERIIHREEIEQVQQWRSSLMVVYSLTLQTCCGKQNSNALQPYFPSMFRILSYVNDDKRREDTVNRYACGLIYDIIACFPQKANELKSCEFFLNYCLNSASSEPRTMDAAQTALDKLSQYYMMSGNVITNLAEIEAIRIVENRRKSRAQAKICENQTPNDPLLLESPESVLSPTPKRRRRPPKNRGSLPILVTPVVPSPQDSE